MPFERQELAKITAAGRAITKATGMSIEEWARGESGIILKMWAGRTKVARAENVTMEARYRAGKQAFGATNAKRNPFGITVNTGKRGGHPGEVWRRTERKKFSQAGQIQNDSSFVPSWKHWKAAAWDQIKAGGEKYAATLARMKPAALKAVALSRQSVVQIADQLGIALESVRGGGGLSAEGIAKARAALASDGRYYQNGTGQTERQAAKFFLTLINRYPRLGQTGMDDTLREVVAERSAYHARNLQLGVFRNLREIERAYPFVQLR